MAKPITDEIIKLAVRKYVIGVEVHDIIEADRDENFARFTLKFLNGKSGIATVGTIRRISQQMIRLEHGRVQIPIYY